MTTYVISPRAQVDIDGIWDYTVERWNEEQAAHYIRALQQAIEIVAADPQRGRSCEQVRPGYRNYPAGSHVIFYRATSSACSINAWTSNATCSGNAYRVGTGLSPR